MKLSKKLSKFKKSKFAKSVLKFAPQWSKNTSFVLIGIIVGIVGVGIANPNHIVQRSLSLVGINSDWEKSFLAEQTAQTDQIKNNDSGDTTKTPSEADTDKTNEKKDDTKSKSSSEQSQPKPTGRDSGSTSIITPEEYQAHADNGETKLIQGTDWTVKVNSRQPTSCGSQANPCPVGTTATVNVSAYNVHTGELLPITECNGSYTKPYVGGEATPTSLPDAYHCILSFTPSSSGMYRLQIELYLSTTVYTDTIYWGGWVWGTDSGTSGGYFVQ